MDGCGGREGADGQTDVVGGRDVVVAVKERSRVEGQPCKAGIERWP